jgi:hypothetical protein
MADTPIPDGDAAQVADLEERRKQGRRTVADAAANGEHEDGDDQLEFPSGLVDAGASGKTLKTLIKAGLPLELTVSMRSAEVPLRGGIPDPDALHRLMVTAELAQVIPVPVREDVGGVRKVVGWKVRAVLRPTFVEAIADADAATG